MGAALYVVLKKKVPAADRIVVDGKMLARAADRLAEAAKRLRVPPLEKFFSVAPATAAALMELPPHDSALPEERWFSPKAGLKTVRALLKNLRKGTADVEEKGQAIEDLVGIEKMLVVADEAGTQFHVALDI